MSGVLAWFGTWEIVLVLVIALLLFGTRLPKVARSLGQGVTEFKKGVKGIKDDVEDATDPDPEEDEEKSS
ncbi:MAG: twin-arginine translocase TatA/TatE family subunit [Planctomycetota bacterium]